MSDNSSSTNVSCGGGFAGLLTVLFIGLKLTNYIDWSWIWVLSPLWISFVFGVLMLVILFIVVLAAIAWTK